MGGKPNICSRYFQSGVSSAKQQLPRPGEGDCSGERRHGKYLDRMGLLSEGEPIDWQEMKSLQHHVRHCGVEQFIRCYNKLKVETNFNLYYLSLKKLHVLFYRTIAGVV